MPRLIRDDRTRLISWRSAIADSDLHSTSKLIGFVLSLHMSRFGDGCFPGTALLMRQASLKKSAVLDHVGQLERDGWLRSRRRGGQGGPKEYLACFPDSVLERLGADLAAARLELSAWADNEGAASSSAGAETSARGFREPSGNRPPGRSAPSTGEDERTGGRKTGAADAAPGAFQLAPYIDQHQSMLPGSIAPAGIMGTVFKQLEERAAKLHPEASAEHRRRTLLNHQRRYLEDLIGTGRASFLSYPKFAETFSEWGPRRGGRRAPAPEGGRNFTEGMEALDG